MSSPLGGGLVATVRATLDIKPFVQNAAKLSQQAATAAKAISRIGSAVTPLAAAFTGGLGVAVKKAAEYNTAARLAVKESEKAAANLAISVSGLVLPAFKALTKHLESFVGWLQHLSPEQKAHIASLVETTAKVMIAVVAFGKFSGIVGTLFRAFSVLAPLFAAIGLPLIVAAAAIGLVITAVGLLHQNFGVTFESIKQIVLDTWKSLVVFFQPVIDAVSTGLDWLKDQFFKLLSWVAQMGDKLGAKFGKDWALTDMVKSLKDISSQPGGLLNMAKSFGAQLVSGFKDGWHEVTSLVKDSPIGKYFKGIAKDFNLDNYGKYKMQDQREKWLPGAQDLLHSGAVQARWAPGDRDWNGRTQQQANTIRTGTQTFHVRGTGPQGKEADINDANAEVRRLLTLREVIKSLATKGVEAVVGMGDTLADINKKLKDTHDVVAETLQKQIEAFKAQRQAIEDSIHYFVGMFVDSMGEAGQLVKSAADGFKNGGVWGAIIEVLIQLLSKSQEFKLIIAMVNIVIQEISDALGLLFKFLEPFLGAIQDVVSSVLKDLAPIFKAFGNILEPLLPIIELVSYLFQALGPLFQGIGQILTVIFGTTGTIFKALWPVFKGVAIVIGAIVTAIAAVWDGILWFIAGILHGLAGVFPKLQKTADDIAGSEINIKAMGQGLVNLTNLTWDQATAQAKATGGTLRMAAAMESATNVLNAPDGFKVNLARWRAMTPTDGSGNISQPTPGGYAPPSIPGRTPGQFSPPPTTLPSAFANLAPPPIVIHVTGTTDPAKVAAQVVQQAQKAGMARAGTPQPLASRF